MRHLELYTKNRIVLCVGKNSRSRWRGQNKEEGTGGGTPAARGVSFSPLCRPRHAEIQVSERRGGLCLPRWGPEGTLCSCQLFSTEPRTPVREQLWSGARASRWQKMGSKLLRCRVLLLSTFMSPREQWTRNTSSLIIATTPRGISIHARLPDPSLPQIPEPHSLVCIYVVALLVTELGPQKVDCSITKKPKKKSLYMRKPCTWASLCQFHFFSLYTDVATYL